MESTHPVLKLERKPCLGPSINFKTAGLKEKYNINFENRTLNSAAKIKLQKAFLGMPGGFRGLLEGFGSF